jgi:dihydroorotate dehydrogenase (NAD+) catalytic subunit
MRNPVTVASGTFASGREYAELWQASIGCDLSILGALTTKGVSAEPWAGNSGIRMTETASGMLNSIGLQNPGVEAFVTKDLPWLAKQNVPVIVNVSGHSLVEYCKVVERLDDEPTVSAFEINISCPNVDCGGLQFGTDPHAAHDVTQRCRELTKKPLIVKLTPNVTSIEEIARACADGGADALSLINTLAGMAVDLRQRKPLFDRVVAGLSGPAIKPVALYALYKVHQAVRLPLLAMGGIANAQDAIEFLLTGATAIAIGAQNFSDPLAAPKIINSITQWCQDEGVADINEIIGELECS